VRGEQRDVIAERTQRRAIDHNADISGAIARVAAVWFAPVAQEVHANTRVRARTHDRTQTQILDAERSAKDKREQSARSKRAKNRPGYAINRF